MRRMRTRSGAIVVAVLACAALLAACSDGDDADGGVSSAGRGPIGAGDQYVALGDSYTSAPYVGKPVGPQGCLRTDANYPHLLAKKADLELTDASCGGATTGDLQNAQDLVGHDGTVPAQLDAVSASTDLVTLSIGGNEGRMFGALVSTCVGLAQSQPDGAPCTKYAEADPEAYERRYAEIRSAIEQAVAQIVARAPGVRVIVVGYPGVFPERGTCDRLPLATGDYPLARDVLQRLVKAQQAAAEKADVEFVDVRPATKGHDICSDDPWVAGITTEKGRAGAPYHPYREEQQAVADVLAKVIAKPRR